MIAAKGTRTTLAAAVMLPAAGFIFSLAVGTISQVGDWSWSLFWVVLADVLAAVSFVAALWNVVEAQRRELDSVDRRFSKSVSDLIAAVAEAKYVSAHVGDFTPVETTSQIASTRNLLRSIRSTHFDGMYPVQDRFSSKLSIGRAEAAAGLSSNFRESGVELEWAVCQYQVSYELSFEHAHLESVRAALPLRAVSVVSSFVALNQQGLSSWEHFFPIRDSLWSMLTADEREALWGMEWLSDTDRSTPTTSIDIHAADGQRIESFDFRQEPLLTGSLNSRRAQLAELDHRLGALRDSAAEGILQVYGPTLGDVELLATIFRSGSV